jgi:flagellar basal-body rod protein FlgF
MDQTGYVLLSRMSAMLRATDVLATNMANADTPAFRANRPVFATQLQRQRDVHTPVGGQSIAYALDRATWRDGASGPLSTTGNPLDVAINGPGFFAVETPRGERFTRAGRFTLGGDGRLLDMEGNALLDTAGRPVTFAANDSRIEILGDGTIRTENGQLGKLRVVRFADEQSMQAEGNRLYATDQPPEAIARPNLVQGSLEGSNVNSVLEMTRLTSDVRAFQMVAQFMETEGKRSSDAVSRILGRAA